MSTKTKLITFAAGAVAATVGNALLNRKSIGSNNSLSEDSHSRLGAARYDLGRPVIDDSFFDGDDYPDEATVSKAAAKLGLGAARYDLGRPVIDDSFFDGDDSPL